MTDFSSNDLVRGRFLRRFMGIEPSSAELAATVEDVAIPAHAALHRTATTLRPALPKTRPTRRPKIMPQDESFRTRPGDTRLMSDAKTGTDPEPR